MRESLQHGNLIEPNTIKEFADRDLSHLLLFSRAIGHILGDRLSRLFMNEEISKDEIRQHFYNPLDQPGELLNTYLHLRNLTTKYQMKERQRQAQV